MKRFFEIAAKKINAAASEDFAASCWNSSRSFSNLYSICKPKRAVFVGSNSAAAYA
jgi:hypothetical protein